MNETGSSILIIWIQQNAIVYNQQVLLGNNDPNSYLETLGGSPRGTTSAHPKWAANRQKYCLKARVGLLHIALQNIYTGTSSFKNLEVVMLATKVRIYNVIIALCADWQKNAKNTPRSFES